MKLEADGATAHWLASSPALEWDEGNATKSKQKHGLSVEEIESVLASPFVFLGRIVEPFHEEARFLLVGKTMSERIVALVFTRRGSLLRPISCRAARKKERQLYGESVGQ